MIPSEYMQGTPPVRVAPSMWPQSCSQKMGSTEWATECAPYVLLNPDLSVAEAPEECLDSKRFVLYMLRRNGEEYSLLPETNALRRDATIIKTALTYSHLFCPDQISSVMGSIPQECKQMARIFLKQLCTHTCTGVTREAWNQFGLGVLGIEFFSDPDIQPIILQQRQWILGGPDQEKLSHIRPIMEKEVQTVGLLLEVCGDELKTDPSFVKGAVRQNGEALQFAQEPAQSDIDVDLTAVSQTYKALLYVPNKSDKILLAALQNAPRNDPEVVTFFKMCIPAEKFRDENFARLALPLMPELTPSFSKEIRDAAAPPSPAIQNEAAQSHLDDDVAALCKAFKDVHLGQTDDQTLLATLKKALLSSPSAEASIEDSIPQAKFKDLNFARLVLPLMPRLYPRFSHKIRNTEELALQVLEKNGVLLSYVPVPLRYKPQVYLTAIKNDTAAYQSIPNVLEDPSAVCEIVSTNNALCDLLLGSFTKEEDRIRILLAAGRILD